MALTRLRTGGIAANAVVAASIAPGAVDITDIADNAITEAKLAANAVTSAKIETNAVTTAQLAANAVTSAKIEANAVTTAQLAANAVTSAKIEANAVTTAQLAANAVTSAKIAPGAIQINNTTIQFAAGLNTAPSISVDGDSNTGIFFSAADTVDITTAGVARAQINSAGDFAINAGFGSVGKAYLCRAWVNFNGTGTVAIRASGNVSSITDNGTGKYTVNFTTAMPDDNYSVSLSGNINNSNDDIRRNTRVITWNSSNVIILTGNNPNSDNKEDYEFVSVAIFR